jgi:hypothetical protein
MRLQNNLVTLRERERIGYHTELVLLGTLPENSVDAVTVLTRTFSNNDQRCVQAPKSMGNVSRGSLQLPSL